MGFELSSSRDVGADEVAALEKKPGAMRFGARVGQAIAERARDCSAPLVYLIGDWPPPDFPRARGREKFLTLSCSAKAEHPVTKSGPVELALSWLLDHPPSRVMTVK